MTEFVATIWPVGIYVCLGIGFIVGGVRWMLHPNADPAESLVLYPVQAFIAGLVWPLWPLAIPAYMAWRLRRRLHPQLRIPRRDLRE